MSTVSAVSRLYWDLASLTEDVQVRREALQSAQQLLKDNQNAADEGTMAPIDVTRAKAEVARRQRDLSVSQTLVRQQGEILKDYLSKSEFEKNLGEVDSGGDRSCGGSAYRDHPRHAGVNRGGFQESSRSGAGPPAAREFADQFEGQ